MFIDNHGRALREVRFRLSSPNKFRPIYRAPESLMVGPSVEEPLHNGEVINLARVFVAMGADHIHLSLAEVGLREGATGLIHGLKSIAGAKTVSLTTMGTDLEKWVPDLVAAGLDEVRVSLDSMRPNRYARITGVDAGKKALAGFHAAAKAGFRSVDANMVVMRGVNGEELPDFVALAKATLTEVRFIELWPFTGVGWMQQAVFPWTEMLENIRSTTPLVEIPSDVPTDVVRFRVPDEKYTLSFVPSLSRAFCSHCDRVRLTSDGQLMACQFSSPDPRLRDALRSGADDAALTDVAKQVISSKLTSRPDTAQLRVLATSPTMAQA